MPIYEFYCPHCHAIYSFLSRLVNTDKRPACPGCAGDTLQRRVSLFATAPRGAASAGYDEGGDPPIDEARMERAMESLAGEAEGLDENDPKAAARLMRRLSDMTGLEYGEKMEQALSRLESGDDPDAIEAEMGDDLENVEDAIVMPGKKGKARKRRPPRRDETLHEM